MRIRTIKPEFWSHPVMCRQHDSVRLLAIALLNIADDEGYFLADHRQIRSQVWPLTEDSVIAHGALITLSELGYISVRTHTTHGDIGQVLKFEKHQRINRPTPSKLKGYFLTESSVSAHGGLTERSLLEQGTGNREQGTGKGRGETEPLALLAECAEELETEPEEKQEPVADDPTFRHTAAMIYGEYPRKVGPNKAMKAICAAMKLKLCRDAAKAAGVDDPSDYLMAKTQNYAVYVSEHPKKFLFNGEMKFVPHPATWFSQGRYLDADFCEWEAKNG